MTSDDKGMGAGKTVLIVDDIEDNRDLLARGLRSSGFETILADGGRRALSLLASHQIDLVLLDWMMPEMDGIETLQRIRQAHSAAQLPVIMCTALSDKASVVHALHEGANDYVTKPVSLPMLRARIALHIGAAQDDAVATTSDLRGA